MTAAEIQSTTQAVLNLIEALPLPVRAKVVEAVRQEYPTKRLAEAPQRKDFDAEAFFEEADRFVEEGQSDYQRAQIR